MTRYKTLKGRLSRGISLEESIRLGSFSPLLVDGKTISTLAREYNINKFTLRSRINAGNLTLDQALTLDLRRGQKI